MLFHVLLPFETTLSLTEANEKADRPRAVYKNFELYNTPGETSNWGEGVVMTIMTISQLTYLNLLLLLWSTGAEKSVDCALTIMTRCMAR